MEFRQLEYFCTISELENFTRTAEVLHVSQPSVTKAIKALEAELQLLLIDRSQKHVCLTDEGRTFLVHAQKIMRDVEMAKQDMQRYQTGAHGVVHFGIPPMLEGYLFPDFFMKFRAAYPNILLDVHECPHSSEIVERVQRGNLDFGIRIADVGKSPEQSIFIMKDEMTLCISKEHPLARREQVFFKDLEHEKFVMQQPLSYQHRVVLDCCLEAGFTPEIVLCASQLKTIKELVANGTGISILPEFVTRMEKKFVRKRISPPMELDIILEWGARKVLSPIDHCFVEFMRKYTETEEFKRHFRQG